VISLKKHIDAYPEELARNAVSAWRDGLAGFGRAGAQALTHLGPDLRQKLSLVQEELSGDVTPDQIIQARGSIEATLTEWGETAEEYSREKTKEIKEIMVAVAATAAAVGERDQRYSSQFVLLTERLQSIAALDDLSSIRRSVLESASELKGVVAKMAEEGEQSISRLRAEVETYREKLEESEKRATVDPLTGAINRRGIEIHIEERISQGARFCVAILDLNGFKRVNDVYGHVAGDELLKQFADELRPLFRARDVVGRWGGDEFVVILDSDMEEAQASLDRVRKWAFGEYRIHHGDKVVPVALSAAIGLTAWDGKETAVALLARADSNMYSDKKAR